MVQRVAAHRDLVLAGMTVLGAPAAGGVLRPRSWLARSDVRAQALEALDSIGERRLGRAIAGLPDPAPRGIPDRDARSGGCAMMATRGSGGWRAGLARTGRRDRRGGRDRRSRDDAAAAAGSAVRPAAPEDLHRVALAARERDFAAGDILIAEGEPGDALFVLLSGRSGVLTATPGGGERLVRTYGEGDHIGELALLRQQPRSASVVADTQVRALIVDGAGLAAILRERPEAAMAMLATLAERISDAVAMAAVTITAALPSGTVTFLRTDVEGSMALAREPGSRWDEANARHVALLTDVIDRNGGAVVRTEGDAVFAAFASAASALRPPSRGSGRSRGEPWPAGLSVAVRMALHSGDTHLSGPDYGGFEVNRAARIAAVGHGNQILLSKATYQLVETNCPAASRRGTWATTCSRTCRGPKPSSSW